MQAENRLIQSQEEELNWLKTIDGKLDEIGLNVERLAQIREDEQQQKQRERSMQAAPFTLHFDALREKAAQTLSQERGEDLEQEQEL